MESNLRISTLFIQNNYGLFSILQSGYVIHLFMHAIPCIDKEFYFFVTFPSFLIHIFFWIFKLEWRLAVLSCTSEIDVLFTPKEDDLKKPSGLSIKKKQLQELEKGGDEIYSRHSYTIKAKTLLSFFFFFLNKMTVRFIKGVLSLNVIQCYYSQINRVR